MPQRRPLLESLNDFLNEVDGIKTASDDPGGYMGKSTHPTVSADSNTQEAEQGSRSSENESDVKEDHPGGGVDNTDPNSGGSQDDKQLNVGTVQSATGEDPEDYKKDKEDPESSHPSHTVEDQGEKYSSMRFPQLCKIASDLANEILADFFSGANYNVQPVKQASQTSQPSEQEVASRAGYELAQIIGQQTKTAAADTSHNIIVQSLLDADNDADLVGSYMHGYYKESQALQKRAEGELPPELLAALQSGGGPPGVVPTGPDGGSDPALGGPEGGMMDAPPEGAVAAPEAGALPPEEMPPEGAPAGGEGQVSEEEALQALLAAMRDMGVPEAELAQSGGEEGAKVAAYIKKYARSGKFQYREAKTAKEQKLRNDMQLYVRELLGA